MKKSINLTDSQIVHKITKGEKELYSRIIKRYQAKLLRYAEYLTGDGPEAMDAVQETFIKAYINLNGFNLKKNFSSWIYRIAHNESLNIIRKKRKVVPLFLSNNLESNENIEDNYIKKELIKSAHKCLKQMPLIYSEVLTLFYLENKSYEDISDILRIPVGTVGTRIARAKAAMKKICQKI